MNFAKTTYGGTVEILASKDFQAIPVKVAGSSVLKAGTPLTANPPLAPVLSASCCMMWIPPRTRTARL